MRLGTAAGEGLTFCRSLIIMDLTREPNAGCRQPPAVKVSAKSSTQPPSMRVLLFAYSGNNKSYYSAKHNHKLEQVRICDHWHQLLSFASPALTQLPFGSPIKSIILLSVSISYCCRCLHQVLLMKQECTWNRRRLQYQLIVIPTSPACPPSPEEQKRRAWSSPGRAYNFPRASISIMLYLLRNIRTYPLRALRAPFRIRSFSFPSPLYFPGCSALPSACIPCQPVFHPQRSRAPYGAEDRSSPQRPSVFPSIHPSGRAAPCGA